ncbi:restriction endonuclease, SacI family [Flavobacterium sp. 14A]|uniref:restriction endonuclease, SacI family n=1 Tax=Flavobacterium sp. 14A TaxID=2735896 RepID=UPI00156DE0CC|nr:restriction endonuclease, SacI family [Flavobacterium sp. 14A]NRT13595.1 DNA (cytosine-5)-methyltransferase 1 [Flavobacterium sp. 14A]
MNHTDKLLEIYKLSYSLNDIKNVNKETIDFIKSIGEKINTQKGVFTVLITLITHKIMNPEQDVRKHQTSMSGGFSGRSIDSVHITPTLKKLGLPSMAESGWLTRSLEQPYPYNLDYNGKISNKVVKEAFLNILDFIEKNPTSATNLLRLLLAEAIASKNDAIVAIVPLKDAEKLTIENITKALDEHFRTKYSTHGGSKLPVLAFFAIYKSLIKEIGRYKDCTLAEMGSHTASDRTSKSAGDIEIFKEKNLFEAIEIKLDKAIDVTIVRIAIEKIARYNPDRYYILSYIGIKESDKSQITELINKLKLEHGCQIIINGLLPTIKYYLRLITSLDDFIMNYSNLIEKDTEIKKIHKEKWNELIEKHLK